MNTLIARKWQMWKFEQGALLNLAYTGNTEFQIVLDNDLILICWSFAILCAFLLRYLSSTKALVPHFKTFDPSRYT